MNARLSLPETPEWKKAGDLAGKEAAAVDWLRRGQAETGFEHAVVLTKTGALVYAGTTSSRNHVRVPISVGLDVLSLHSHPDEVSLSGQDFASAWAYSPESEVRAFTPGGGCYAGQAIRNPAAWLGLRRSAIVMVASQLRVLERRDRNESYRHLAAHLVNAAMVKSGSIRYAAMLSNATKLDLECLAFDLAAIREAIDRMFRDGR